MDRRIDIAVAAAFLLLGLFMIWGASEIKQGMMRDPIGPRAAFYVCGGLLVLGAAFVILGHVRRWLAQPGHLVRNEGTADEDGFASSGTRAWVLIGAVVCFALLFQPLGFLLATPLFVWVALAILGKRNWVRMTAIALIFTALTYGIFGQVLSVRLPVGPFTQLFRDLGWINL
jgi:putative tricarboxylic transport membrane protein